MTDAIYNEIEPYACEWLENLIAAGHIAPGRVDRRSIADLTAADVAGLGQRHFFGGIGGWSCALRLAGVPDDTNVWTGSCPCQPFSKAGKGLGTSDARHLWPAWFELIRECKPAVVLGEQVAGPDGLAWLDLVRADLEGCGYAFGASDLCAASVGAPHIRQRLYFVAHAGRERFEGQRLRVQPRQSRSSSAEIGRGGQDSALADGDSARSQGRGTMSERPCERPTGPSCVDGGVADRDRWSDCEWIPCRDPEHGVVYRPVEPGTFPLAHGVPGRVGRLRGYGNAIVPELAAAFIQAALSALQEQR